MLSATSCLPRQSAGHHTCLGLCNTKHSLQAGAPNSTELGWVYFTLEYCDNFQASTVRSSDEGERSVGNMETENNRAAWADHTPAKKISKAAKQRWIKDCQWVRGKERQPCLLLEQRICNGRRLSARELISLCSDCLIPPVASKKASCCWLASEWKTWSKN